MKLSVFLLSLLLDLCWSALQDVTPQPTKGSLLTPDLEDGLSEIPLNGSASALQTPPNIHRNRWRKPSRSQTSLMWMTTAGGVPSGAVFSVIPSTGRRDYVCSYRCIAGFYNPRMGRHCHYPFAGKEMLGAPFKILVKRNRSEVLSWKTGSQGAVPKNSVQTCRGVGQYVGRNGGGLGSVSVAQKAFLLPRNGRVFYFRSYQALTYN